MKNPYFLSAILALILAGCQPVELSPEQVYQNSIASLRLTNPATLELPLGATLDLKELLQITYKDNQPQSIPTNAIRAVANENSSATSVFSATTAGTYVLKANVGDKTSNSITVTVLPFSLVRIPVVFHAVNSTLSASQINRLVQGMTDAYRNRWNPYGGAKDGNAVDSFIEFYAADTDPSGRALAVPGLDLVTSSRQTFSSEQAVDDAWNSYWNPKRFLNIWMYNIDPAESLSGFAYISPVTRSLPGLRLVSASRTNPDLPYGIFYNRVDLNNVQSSTLAHEAGHVLGLYHVFDGNGEESKTCSATDPDYCADTPYYDRNSYMDNFRSLRLRREACDGSSYVSTNIMDYSLSYENSFTRLQRDRIRHTLTYGLWVPATTSSQSRLSAEVGYMHTTRHFQES